MAQKANLVLNSGTAVATTFLMEANNDPTGYQSWANRASGIFSQFIRVFTKNSIATAKRPTNRGEYGVQLPVVRTINGVPTVVGTIRITTQSVAPTDATQTEVNDAYAFHVNGLNHALVRGQLRDGDYIS